MVSFKTGGDPEDYMGDSFMQAPTLPGSKDGDKGGMSPIAAFLNLIGIGKPVANAPKKSKPAEGSSKDQGAESKPDDLIAPAAPKLSVLDEAESAFQPMTPLGSDWGRRYLDSVRPLKTIDPNQGF